MFLKGSWATDTFVTNYLPLVLFPIVYVGARYWRRTEFIRPEDMDFKTGLAEVEAASYDEPPPRNWVERVWAWLVSCLSIPVTSTTIFMLELDVKIPIAIFQYRGPNVRSKYSVYIFDLQSNSIIYELTPPAITRRRRK